MRSWALSSAVLLSPATSCLPLLQWLFCLLMILVACCHDLTVSDEAAGKMIYILNRRIPGKEELRHLKKMLLN